jgi:hypothetical protein
VAEEGGERQILFILPLLSGSMNGLCERRAVKREDLDSKTILGMTCLGCGVAHVVEIKGEHRAIR